MSSPSRAVLMTGAELGIGFEQRIIDLLSFEHKKPEFIQVSSPTYLLFLFISISIAFYSFTSLDQLNPQHTVPLLDDNGVLIADSHAICAYLSETYGTNDRLYPNDLVKRAMVDARMHFNSGHLFARLRFLCEPILYYHCS